MEPFDVRPRGAPSMGFGGVMVLLTVALHGCGGGLWPQPLLLGEHGGSMIQGTDAAETQMAGCPCHDVIGMGRQRVWSTPKKGKIKAGKARKGSAAMGNSGRTPPEDYLIPCPLLPALDPLPPLEPLCEMPPMVSLSPMPQQRHRARKGGRITEPLTVPEGTPPGGFETKWDPWCPSASPDPDSQLF